MAVKDAVNQVLVKLFRNINDLEEKAVCKGKFSNVTINEMHVIEAIGTDVPKNMSTVARELGVTTGTLTIAVNSLVKKGLVNRVRSEEDRRVVIVCLTDLGNEAYRRHSRFHEKMVNEITDSLSEDEAEVLLKALTKLNNFFESQKQK